MARRFHDSRFDPNRFDATAAASLWPPYLHQEYPLQRVAAIAERRRDLVRVVRMQRIRQRPMTAFSPKTNLFNAPAVMFKPWVTWTLKPPGTLRRR